MNKNLQIGWLAVLLSAGATTAHAQVSFGPRVGLNLADISQDYKDLNDEPDTKLYLGGQVGLSLHMRFGNLALQPSVLLSQKGIKRDDSQTAFGITVKTTGTERLNYLEVPVNLVYTTGGKEGFQVFLGPYAGLGLGGKYDVTRTAVSGATGSYTEAGEVKFASKAGTTAKTDYVRSLDFGLNAGVGYKVGPVQMQLGYGLGLSNLVPNDSNDKAPEDEINNRVIQLSVAYFFE
ncbi:porin family protein [Hymenobacter algoricola]|uniref:Outer membrane protein beta-barrel domain-containing protein n=1 Tax=Hymenobacter algoricola TaxID=486267 RepID=A0ABP7NVR2_9BACT